MQTGTVIRLNRERARLTQAALARRVGVSESTLRLYELGIKNVPHDVANLAAVALQAPDICFSKCSECPVNWLSVCVLSSDKHPSTEILRVLQESREAIAAVEQIATGSLDKASRQAVERACDQVLDLGPLAAAAVASWCGSAGIDMRDVCNRHRRKLVQRGYIYEGVDAA